MARTVVNALHTDRVTQYSAPKSDNEVKLASDVPVSAALPRAMSREHFDFLSQRPLDLSLERSGSDSTAWHEAAAKKRDCADIC